MIQLIVEKSNRRPLGTGFVILIFLYLMLFIPFWKPVVLGVLFAAACGPLERRLREVLHSRRKPVAYGVLATVSIVASVLLVIIGVQTYALLFEAFGDTNMISNLGQRFAELRGQIWARLESYELFVSMEWHKQLERIINSTLVSTRDTLLAGASAFFAATPEILLNLFIFTLAFAAFLLMGSKPYLAVAQLLSFNGDSAEQFRRFERVCFISLGSVLLTGVLQSSIVVVGAWICGLSNYFLIFAVTFIFSMIPLLGAGLVAAAFALVALFQGDMFVALTMGITAGVTGVADNLLKAWLFSKAAKTNAVISLISLLGGIALLGFAGLFIAPTIEQLVMAEYHRRKSLSS